MAYAPYTASSTGGSRSFQRDRSGTSNAMPASRMRRFARTSRCAIAGAGTANAAAIARASTPSTDCSMSGVRMPGSIAGWAHTNSSASSRSGNGSGSAGGAGTSRASSSATDVRRAAERSTSVIRCRPTVMSHPSGLAGTPARGQSSSARSNANARASSARPRSRVGAARAATSRP